MNGYKKKKGADLRDFYYIHFQAGLIITLLVFNIVFRVNFTMDTEFRYTPSEQDVILMEEVIRTEQELRPPPPPRPPAPRIALEDEIVEEVYFDLGTDFSIHDGLLLPLKPPSIADPEDDEEYYQEIFTIVEEMPQLIGGLQAIYQKLKYPEIALKAGIEGRVIVQFVIDEHGFVIDPVVVRGIGGGCDEAAIEAIKNVQFTPGRQRGRPVKVRYSVPIIFRLTS